MSVSTTSPPGKGAPELPPLRLRDLARKSALLNLGIVATAVPAALLIFDPRGWVVAAVAVGLVSLVVWSVTFAVFSVRSVARIYAVQNQIRDRRAARGPGPVGDRWLDGPAVGARNP